MSYQVLARKWRPRSFASLVGQEHVVRALTHALETGRLHHAWLFTGTRGVGKTTISRILAKALNCESGVTATPCGECEACLSIDADRFPDYIEMDAASSRGVDDMAALLDRAAYVPVQGRYKVYMIDEVHMLTGHAFNAMLKTLEEPPEHVKFILATTDPQKIPVTVLSRCLQFNLKQMPRAAICEHLAQILQAEGVPFEASALTHLAHGANGSMRDALSLLDQAIAHGAGRVEQGPVMLMLGTVGDDHLIELLAALAAEDVDRLLAVAADMAARTLSFDAALQALAAMLHRVALLQFAPAGLDEAERARLAPFAEAFDAEFLQLAYQIVIHGRGDLSLAPDEYAGFTMTLLRLLAFRPENMPPGRRRPLPSDDATAADGAVSAVEAVAHQGDGAQAVAQAPRPERERVTPAEAPHTAAPETDDPPWDDVPPWEELPEASPMETARVETTADERVLAGADTAVVVPAAAETPPAERSRADASDLAALCEAGDWRGVIAMVAPDGLVRELCQHCEWVGRENGVLRLRLSAAQRHFIELNPDLPDRLAQCFAAHGDAVRVQIEVGEIEAGTPAQAAAAERQQRHRTALAALEQDPFVREVIQRFDAALIEASIQPLPNNTSGDAR